MKKLLDLDINIYIFWKYKKSKCGQVFHAKWEKTTYYYFTSRSSRKVRDFDKKKLYLGVSWTLGKVLFWSKSQNLP